MWHIHQQGLEVILTDELKDDEYLKKDVDTGKHDEKIIFKNLKLELMGIGDNTGKIERELLLMLYSV